MTILREGILFIEFALLVIYGIIMIIEKVKISKLLFNLSFGLYLSVVIAFCFFPNTNQQFNNYGKPAEQFYSVQKHCRKRKRICSKSNSIWLNFCFRQLCYVNSLGNIFSFLHQGFKKQINRYSIVFNIN